jgi:hypothetical protein
MAIIKLHIGRRFRMVGLGCLLPILVILAVLYGLYEQRGHELQMSPVPADLQVTSLLYSKEQNWGSSLLPLPGDNETGILAYSLSDEIASSVADKGLGFFYRPENVERREGMQRTHSEWHETPMKTMLSDYLNQYGFGIEVDPSIKALVDDAISKPGSFYSYGRIGVVIVIPKAKRAIFAYAG